MDKAHIRIEWVKGRVEESDTFCFSLPLTRRRSWQILGNQNIFIVLKGTPAVDQKIHVEWKINLRNCCKMEEGKGITAKSFRKTAFTEAEIKQQSKSLVRGRGGEF